ncbi:unannotated protein [freshwater metagenome]|uniref:Unannotated protein n=1 Tax=freshwater metagenome TaxID=449393 RepID=A0A6J6KXV1_9ZZZZ
MAVLLPPVLRSRFDGGGVSSVSDFRRQLNTLQRTQGPVGAPHAMRAMSRPLAPAPRSVPGRALPGRPMPSRAPMQSAPTRGYQRPRLVASDGMLEQEPRHRRSHHTAELPRHHFAAESAFMSPREVVRRRRVNVLYGLIAANALTLFLGLTTGSSMMVYAFTVAFLGLGAYCYILVQLRNQEYLRRYYGQRHAA